jgi:hypothetical protein
MSSSCVEALRTDRAVFATGDQMVQRWGDVGTAIRTAGYEGVHAYPMHWHGRAIGGLNIFLKRGTAPDLEVGQMFADLSTLALLQSNDIAADQLIGRVHDAMTSRAAIEQAKGVLAHQNRSDMDAAYGDLLAQARQEGRSLTAVAVAVVGAAHRGDERRHAD